MAKPPKLIYDPTDTEKCDLIQWGTTIFVPLNISTTDPIIPARLAPSYDHGAGIQEYARHDKTTHCLYPCQQVLRYTLHRCYLRSCQTHLGHQQDLVAGFIRKYQVHTLVYFEQHGDMTQAIQREKQLKKWNRAWEIELIEKDNPTWRDLWPEIL